MDIFKIPNDAINIIFDSFNVETIPKLVCRKMNELICKKSWYQKIIIGIDRGAFGRNYPECSSDLLNKIRRSNLNLKNIVLRHLYFRNSLQSFDRMITPTKLVLKKCSFDPDFFWDTDFCFDLSHLITLKFDNTVLCLDGGSAIYKIARMCTKLSSLTIELDFDTVDFDTVDSTIMPIFYERSTLKKLCIIHHNKIHYLGKYGIQDINKFAQITVLKMQNLNIKYLEIRKLDHLQKLSIIDCINIFDAFSSSSLTNLKIDKKNHYAFSQYCSILQSKYLPNLKYLKLKICPGDIDFLDFQLSEQLVSLSILLKTNPQKMCTILGLTRLTNLNVLKIEHESNKPLNIPDYLLLPNFPNMIRCYIQNKILIDKSNPLNPRVCYLEKNISIPSYTVSKNQNTVIQLPASTTIYGDSGSYFGYKAISSYGGLKHVYFVNHNIINGILIFKKIQDTDKCTLYIGHTTMISNHAQFIDFDSIIYFNESVSEYQSWDFDPSVKNCIVQKIREKTNCFLCDITNQYCDNPTYLCGKCNRQYHFKCRPHCNLIDGDNGYDDYICRICNTY